MLSLLFAIPYLLLKLNFTAFSFRNRFRSNSISLFISNASYFLYHEVHLRIAVRYNFYRPYHFGYNHALNNNLIVHVAILHQRLKRYQEQNGIDHHLHRFSQSTDASTPGRFAIFTNHRIFLFTNVLLII